MSFGGEEVALVDEAGGLGVGLGLEDEAGAMDLAWRPRGWVESAAGAGWSGEAGWARRSARERSSSRRAVSCWRWWASRRMVSPRSTVGAGSGAEVDEERRRAAGGGFGGFLGFGLGGEDLAGAGDGVALVVEQALDAEGHFDVALAVEALAGAAFVGLELGELGLPEAEDVGGDVAELGYIADTEVELVRDDGGLGGNDFTNWMM